MKKLITLALVALMALAGTTTQAYAQENNNAAAKQSAKAQRDAERARQKAEAAYVDSLMHQSAVAAIEGRQFVLEADKVIFKHGETAYVNTNTNFVLMNDDLRSVPAALEIGRATLKNIKENLFFAFCYNVVCIPIAAGLPVLLGFDGLVDQMPMISALAMACSSVSVVSNALRLRKFRPRALGEAAPR